MAHYTNLRLEESLLLTQRIARNSSGYEQYIGYAPAGSAETQDRWVIVELIYDSSDNMIQKLFAEGSIGFNLSWSERTGYDYI